MKRILFISLIALLTWSITFAFGLSDYNVGEKPLNKAMIEIPELDYQDVITTLLMPYIDESLNKYYSEYLYEIPGVSPSDVKIVSINRPNGDRTSLFVISLSLQPYLGPHNTVGTDNIIFEIKYGKKPKTIKFEHIKSNKLPSSYNNIIKKWPPE
ncbi:DUF3888 domain-containing protein [Lutispora sp.]|uniref:DUF3888 domain-containing protein n=1 Tax=Lutispora sp. TaxID=2828727 RepID=UPI0035673947